MWTLDPIDGTKGFLRGGQYAVCLALLVDARVELGIIGCPNLPIITPSTTDTDATTTTTTNDDKGALFVAVRGHGAHQLPLSPRETDAPSTPQQLHMPRLALHDLAFLESVEKAHAALDTNARAAARLGVRAAPVRMDSQAKYAALARGDSAGGVYLRLPVARGGGSGGYQEKIWVRVSCLGLFLMTYSFIPGCLGPRAGIAARRGGRRRHFGLSWARSGLWTWAHARRELWCRCGEEGGACGGDCSCSGGVGGGGGHERRWGIWGAYVPIYYP